MRDWFIVAVLSVTSACGRGPAIYAGSDVPLAGHGAVVSEGPIAGGAGEGHPGAQPVEEPRTDGGPLSTLDASAARDASAPPRDAGAGERDSGTDTVPDAAPPRDAGLVCEPGRADCDGDPANGCEVDLPTTAEHCGACGHACHADGTGVSAAACVAGTCRLTCQFAPILGDCDGDPDNGCETDLWHDPNNCSVCGMHCNRCADGVCR